MPVDSPEIRNEAQIVNLDFRTKRSVERKFRVMPHQFERSAPIARG